VTGLVGAAGAGDNISIGQSPRLLLPVPVGATSIAGVFTSVADDVDSVPAREAVAGYGATGMVSPTTAPNGARVYWFGYRYELANDHTAGAVTITDAGHDHAAGAITVTEVAHTHAAGAITVTEAAHQHAATGLTATITP
jgi:hypothetical protein